MTDLIGQQLGNYLLIRQLGQGGFAEVYLGQHVRLASKQAAIKVLHLFDVDAQKFQQEAETTEQLVHPHIVRLLDFDLQQGTPFLVLDYAPDGSLRTRHPKGSRVSIATVKGYLKEVAPALQYAHDKNILHRDIKLENILIGRQGELLLSDFGMAVFSQTGHTSLQASYSIGGTPFYMAPEQYRGKPEKASDQYALAVVVYEWLGGTVPFSEGSFIQLGYQHNHEPVPPLRTKNPAISPEEEAVIMKALAKDPRDRFESVQAFAAAFEQASQVTPSHPVILPTPGALPSQPSLPTYSKNTQLGLYPGSSQTTPVPNQISQPTLPRNHASRWPIISLLGAILVTLLILASFVLIPGLSSVIGIGGTSPTPTAPSTTLQTPSATQPPTPITPTLLAAPVQISPASSTVFNNYPRTTTLTWNAVPGAVSYNVQIYFYPPGDTTCTGGTLFSGGSSDGQVRDIRPTTGTSYTFSFVGAQPGCWQAWAVDSSGRQGSKSSLWEFSYTQ